MGKSSSPKQPDYVAAAQAEAQGNLDLARYATQANRVNQYTPWGNLTWTNDRSFNQAGFDAAMNAYSQSLQGSSGNGPAGGYTWAYDGTGSDGDYGRMVPVGAGSGGSSGAGQLSMPNPEDFYTGGDNWSQNVSLSPEMQAQLDQQNRIQQGLFGAQNAALGRVNDTMSQGLNTASLPAQASALNTSRLPSMGTALDPSGLSSWGRLGSVLNINSLPAMGTALDINSLPAMAEAFQASGQGLDIYDPNLQTNNATELIMQRLNPQLDQQQEALRAQLANQGIVQGTEAYDRAMMQHQQARNDAQRGAALEGINLGMQQQGLQFNQNLSNRGLLASEHDLMYGHQQGLRHGEAGLQGQRFDQMQGLRHGEAALQAQRFAQQTTNNQILAARRAQEAAEQGQQYNQQQGLRTTEAGLQNQQYGQQQGLRNSALQEQAYLRSLPFQELSALTGGSQVSMPQFPGYAQQATTGGANLLGATQAGYQSALNASNAQNAQNANLMSGLFGIGGALVGGPAGPAISALGGLFSDRRLKRDITRVGTTNDGLGVYTYRYVWGGPVQMGVMADEVQRVAPHAVRSVGGYLAVNYGAL